MELGNRAVECRAVVETITAKDKIRVEDCKYSSENNSLFSCPAGVFAGRLYSMASGSLKINDTGIELWRLSGRKSASPLARERCSSDLGTACIESSRPTSTAEIGAGLILPLPNKIRSQRTLPYSPGYTDALNF
jgi:hypothetical protein